MLGGCATTNSVKSVPIPGIDGNHQQTTVPKSTSMDSQMAKNLFINSLKSSDSNPYYNEKLVMNVSMLGVTLDMSFDVTTNRIKKQIESKGTYDMITNNMKKTTNYFTFYDGNNGGTTYFDLNSGLVNTLKLSPSYIGKTLVVKNQSNNQLNLTAGITNFSQDYSVYSKINPSYFSGQDVTDDNWKSIGATQQISFSVEGSDANAFMSAINQQISSITTPSNHTNITSLNEIVYLDKDNNFLGQTIVCNLMVASHEAKYVIGERANKLSSPPTFTFVLDRSRISINK